MDAVTAEKQAAEILFGLGFTKQMQAILWWLAYENCFGKGTVYESNNPFA
jgi:hypothetical protein